ncbi:MAG TPA: hypothetical protein VMZ30_08230, partial [Pyrinomonadaceae bacterium]|nr:hypothetical protein [Pyrinomonadaceae bacterium]
CRGWKWGTKPTAIVKGGRTTLDNRRSMYHKACSGCRFMFPRSVLAEALTEPSAVAADLGVYFTDNSRYEKTAYTEVAF